MKTMQVRAGAKQYAAMLENGNIKFVWAVSHADARRYFRKPKAICIHMLKVPVVNLLMKHREKKEYWINQFGLEEFNRLNELRSKNHMRVSKKNEMPL
jgi:hypothetical protein